MQHAAVWTTCYPYESHCDVMAYDEIIDEQCNHYIQ